MAASSKFDPSSGNTDRPTYPSMQRGMYTAASLDRSGSFREGMDNRISTSPSMSRSSSSVTQGDVINFFHGLPFNTKLMAPDHRCPRLGEVKRVITSACGVSPDDSLSLSLNGKPSPAFSLEELKRVRTNISESSNRARERLKTLEEAASKFDKCFPSISARKRSRVDISLSDRSSASLPCDRAVLGGNMTKLGTQNHVMTSNFDIDPQKLEERSKKTKGAAPNKRIRTSIVDMDVQANDLTRPPVAMDKDKETFRFANNGVVPSEEKDRTLPIVGDGWEKSKMRKKRSGIKSDASTGTVTTKHVDGDRESKWTLQQRLLLDARPKLSNAHGFRSTPGIGASGGGKVDMTPQQNGLGFRSSSARTDQDSGSLPNETRDRTLVSEKERVNLKAVNRPNVREDSVSSGGPTSITKLTASARAPRSGSCMIPKSSPSAHRAIGVTDEWELSQCMNKAPAVVGASNRKRPPSTRSSSPPVAQWAGQRPQKISRVARRTNLVPPVPVQDESPTSDTVSHAAGNGNGLGFPRRLSSNTSRQVKVKGDLLSSAALSESEESGAAEIKSRDNGKKSGEPDERTGQNVQKVSTPVLPSRKNKGSNNEELGDGLRKQERTARGFTSTRSSMPMTDGKLNNVVTAKQLRSTRPGLEKTDSKAGRPPTKKLSDRKAYKRPRFAMNGGAVNFHGKLDDGHEELMAAAKDAINPSNACSSSFWRQMEPLFGFVSAEDVAFLRQQISLINKFTMDMNVNTSQNLKDDFGISLVETAVRAIGQDDCGAVLNGLGSIESERDKELTSEIKPDEFFSEQFFLGIRDHNVVPLCGRLIAALISEDENGGFCSNGDEDLNFNIYGTSSELDEEFKSNSLSRTELGNFQTVARATSNGYRIRATRRRLDQMEHDDLGDVDVLPDTTSGIVSNFRHSLNGLQPDQAVMPVKACSELQYEKMTLNERLLLELQCIGIFPEPVPDLALREDDKISEEISSYQEKLRDLVNKKKTLLLRLEGSVSEERESQEREIERNALDKLVGMAYDKYMACWGPHASGGKGSSGKMAKHAALSFVKRTLERCQNYEDAGKSCFNEPVFKELFHSVSSSPNDAEFIHTMAGGEPANPCADTHSLPSEVRDSASKGLHQTPSATSRLRQNIDAREKNPSDVFCSENHLSEPTTGKEETWMSRAKRRELLLDELDGGNGGSSLRAPSGVGSALVTRTKGKRSEREKEGKGHNRDLSSRNGTGKIGRPALGSNVKGERKSKTKPKQKTTHLSASANGLLGKASEPPKSVLPPVPKACEMASDSNIKKNSESALETLNDTESIDLSNLQLPGMDVLGGQGQDLESWLNIEDDGLQDHDFMGLEIPMDDLFDLNMIIQVY
ncbi:uncharacterized protein LOC122068667 isoform X2 [Macadamia integrifolia]|uniref:uncharacterized protein LOC122068667 isoform X2 n=1 Tax=Macadamia integrifolia TaxID=60698 RepID=UPI001C50235F|nr:uncharacterized protein LOC122068667 isoform X2 [Macadamia integrifolia]